MLDEMIDVLSQVENKISIYWSLGYGSVAFRSQFEINVFPFKYMEEYNFDKEEIGLVQGRIMSRFTFSMYHDNALKEDQLKRFNYELVSVDELRERIKERKAKRGIR